MIRIRPARADDASALAEIYNYYIENTTVTMELKKLDAETFGKRIEKIGSEFPWLVYEEDGKILGYGYLSFFNERAAYRFTCDLSLYVDKDARGKGIGSALFGELEEKARELGFSTILSLVTSENLQSAEFHLKHGFEKVAELPSVAFKFKRWLGLTYYRKVLSLPSDPESGER